MKNKLLKAIVATILIIVITMADFILVGVNLVTYALEDIDDSTNHQNVKFAAYFKTKEGETSEAGYEMNSNEMKLYVKVVVTNSGYFDGTLTLGDSNFMIKQDKLPEGVTSFEGNTVVLNRVRAGNSIEIEFEVEPIIEESYEDDMLVKESELTLTGKYYLDDTEKYISIEQDKEVTLNLLAPSNIETALEGKVITNEIFTIEEVEQRIVQIELNSGVVNNAYPIQSTTFDVALPEGAEVVEVISKGTYVTNGEDDKKLDASAYAYDETSNSLKITINNPSKHGKISWAKEGKDSIVVTLRMSKDQKIGEEKYTAKAEVKFYGEEKTKDKTLEYSLTENANGIITASIENKEEIYKGKMYSQEDREYSTTTNIEVNYANLLESATLQENTIYKTETEDKQSNIAYKTTTISKEEFDKVLGTNGKLVIKDQNGAIVKEIASTDFGTNESLTIEYTQGVTAITIELTKATGTGIIRLNHTKAIQAIADEDYVREDITELKYLVESVERPYGTVIYKTEVKTELKEVSAEAVLTVIPKTILAGQANNMQMAITLKTDKESYELFQNPKFVINMPEGVKINSVSNESISASDGELTISNIETNGQRGILIEITGEQQKYITSEINTQINFTANVTMEKLMPNKVDTIQMQYQNQGKIYEFETETINLIASQDKIVTNIKVKNYNGLGTTLEKYSDNTKNVMGELPLENSETIKAPIEYTIVNNYDSDMVITGILSVTYKDKEGNSKRLLNYADTEITINAGEMKTIDLSFNIPAELYYSEEISVETLTEYTYLGTKYSLHNNINFVTEEKQGIRDISIIDDKIQVETFAQLGDGSGVKENDEIYDEQTIEYIIEVTNISNETISNLVVKNTQENGNIYDLKEVLVTDRVTERIEHTYEELDTNEKIFEIENLEPGESIELTCRVIVKKTDASTTTANISVLADNIGEQIVTQISNKVKTAQLKISTKNALKEEVEMIANNMISILTNVENLTSEDTTNVKIRKYMSEGLEYHSDFVVEVMDEELEVLDILSNVTYNEEEQYVEFTLTELKANQKINILSYIYAQELPLDEISKEVTIYTTANEVISNSTKINIVQAETALTITQSINVEENQKVKDGETIIITAQITNIGHIATSVMVEDTLPTGLEVLKVYSIKENNVIDETENAGKEQVCVVLELDEGETASVKIEAIVNTSRITTEEITNKISATPQKGETAISNEVSIKIESNVDTSTGTTPEEPEIEVPEAKDPVIDEEDKDPDKEEPGEEKPEKPGEGDGENQDQEKETTYTISGYAWVDGNENGTKDDGEAVKNVIVKIIDLDNKNIFVKNENGQDIEVKTNEAGEYKIESIKEGNYSIIFKYDTSVYELKTAGFIKDYIIENTNEKVAITDKIKLNTNKLVDLELVELAEFDLKIDKYISKVIVQTSNETKTTTYTNKQLVREEIQKKYLSGATVIVEYTIQITNIGELAGCATEIVDYLPSGMKFYSELNTQWYMSEDSNLYNTSLASTEINPGETKAIKLTLLKTMTKDNTGTTANNVEISETSNLKQYSDKDLDNNQSKAEIIINPATGIIITYAVAILNAIAIVAAGIYVINKKIVRRGQINE